MSLRTILKSAGLCIILVLPACGKKKDADVPQTEAAVPPPVYGGATPVVRTGSYDANEPNAFLDLYGRENFSAHYQSALTTFHQAEYLCAGGSYVQCKAQLDALWAQYPEGDQIWGALQQSVNGSNTGSPAFYYALRMLSDIADWHTGSQSPSSFSTVTLTVLLVGQSQGIMPTNETDLAAGTGVDTVNTLHPFVAADDFAMIRESLQLFSDYVYVSSDGRLRVEPKFVSLDTLSVPVKATAGEARFSGLDYANAMPMIWGAVPQEIKNQTDWWWIVYPSHVPERYEAFRTTEFVAGGMGGGPDGRSPAFMCDDLWLVRKPPHLGTGDYTSLERRAYLPQWLQHEFFHHLFQAWPDFKLEDVSHKWFNRSSWPADFTGIFEPDYFHESLHKRIKPQGSPPMAVRLLYAQPSAADFSSLNTSDICGVFERQPVENGWHKGRITAGGAGGALKWTNDAAASWDLTLVSGSGRLMTGGGNPYLGSSALSDEFTLQFSRKSDGSFDMVPAGFLFNGENFVRTSAISCQ